MRRHDRALHSREEIVNVLKCGKIAQIAFVDGTQPYIVSMNYGYAIKNDQIQLYFHSANQGRKIDCIHHNPEVCFTIAISDPFIGGEKACNYGMKYRSVVGYGTIKIVEDGNERIAGLNALMNQVTGKENWDYDDEMLKKTTVTCIDVRTITGKSKR
jgi:nitroimidazol reductase NimA-like FMN-containing flavoprotein (pyridoxamine 5'-phosphate oxidase superfamily)